MTTLSPSWADDPELLATFRAEVDERIASLSEGLLRLERHPSPRQLVAGLFRDAHTVKGSARMLGLDAVVSVAHRSEDLLGALRDGRVDVRPDVVTLLLAAADAVSRALPGADRPVTAADLAALVAAMDGALAGDDPVVVPPLGRDVPGAGGTDGDADGDDAHPEGGDPDRADRADRVESVRVPATRVHDLLDVIGEAELDVRRLSRQERDLAGLGAEHARVLARVRAAAAALPPAAGREVADAVTALAAVADQMSATGRDLQTRVEDAAGRLARVREGAMSLAMVPVRRVVAAFPQLVREVALGGGKDVVLTMSGQDVELDARVLDAVADALRHLVTNAVDHGCEPPTERVAAGKPARATVSVTARSAGSSVVVEVADDGRGVDEAAVRAAAVERGLLAPSSTLTGPALLQLVFEPGLSTRGEVSETSGRGVGLDVVRTVVEELGGDVEIAARPGGGTRFTMTLPVTLGVLRCLVARVGAERYALPVGAVVETVSLRDAVLHDVAGVEVLARHGATYPLVSLGDALGVPGGRERRSAVLVRYGGGDVVGWTVDALEGELELVVKELGGFLGRLPSVAGATIDGDGSVVLVLDVRELAERYVGTGIAAPSAAPVPAGSGEDADDAAAADRAAAGPDSGADAGVPRPRRGAGRPVRVLVVEDSVGVRELQRVILEGAGYEVAMAVDGLDGASRLSGPPVDLVLSDVEMPGMDGFALTRTIRRTPGWADVPVVIMTSRGDDADRHAGLDAGASAYLLKSQFDQDELLETVRRLVGG